MSRHNHAVLVCDDWNLEAEVPDGCSDGVNGVIVEPWVHPVRLELFCSDFDDFHFTLNFCPFRIRFLFLMLFHAISCFCVVLYFFAIPLSVSPFFTV